MTRVTIADRLADGLLAVILLSLIPAASILLWFNYAAISLIANKALLYHSNKKQGSRSRIVLIGGAASLPGVKIARAFHLEGHRVIGVDFRSKRSAGLAFASKAFSKVHYFEDLSAIRDRTAYARDLFQIIRGQKVDLWIDCQRDLDALTIDAAKSLIEGYTNCAVIALGRPNADYFDSAATLLEHLRSRGLPAPETHQVRTRAEIHDILNAGKGKKQWLLEDPRATKAFNPRTLLPRRTLSQTYRDVSLIKIAVGSPLMLQEYVDHNPKFKCFAIVVRGTVKAFVAAAEHGDRALKRESALSSAMHRYVQKMCLEFGSTFTSNLSVTFCVVDKIEVSGVIQQVLPIGARPCANDLVHFFTGRSGSQELTTAYLSIFNSDANGAVSQAMVRPAGVQSDRIVVQQASEGVYSMPQDLKRLVILPTMQCLLRSGSTASALRSTADFFARLAFWNEVLYSFDDPFPAFWHYLVRLPLELVVSATSRVNAVTQNGSMYLVENETALL